MDYIKLKGIKNGLKAVFSNAAKFEDAFSEFESKLKVAVDLFKTKKDCVFVVEGSLLTHENKCQIQRKIFEILGSDLLIKFEEPIKELSTIASPSVFHTGTIRGGQNIHSEGHLVIVGDVNPGAEISANGNIIVLGVLRGLVHAGAAGDRSAYIIAIGLAPTQIRIADIITRAPDDVQITYEPEMALVRDNKIYIDAVIKH